MKLFAAIAAALACVAAAEPTQVKSLPSFRGSVADLPFSMYSGYVDIPGNRSIFYWFVESQSNPSTDPLVVWYQGGPGCSGLGGFLTENGPFRAVYDEGDGTALEYQPALSWNTKANVIYLEQPVGVGFSYAGDSSAYNSDDSKAEKDNLAFLQGWLQDFPSYQGRPLWLTGESYGGNYVPQLAQGIIEAGGTLAQQFAGVMIGNPVFSCPAGGKQGNTVYTFAQIAAAVYPQNYYSHGVVPLSIFNEWKQLGCDDYTVPTSNECSKLQTEMANSLGPFDGDDINADLCAGNSTLGPAIGDDAPCDQLNFGVLSAAYLNRADVQHAIGAHAPPAGSWGACSPIVNYTLTWPSNAPNYEAMFNSGKRVVIYSGDFDVATCPFQTTQICIDEMGYKSTGTWAPWLVRGFTAGYVQEYGNRLTIATIKAGGHEVPTFQPLSAYTLFQNVLDGVPIGNGDGSPRRKLPGGGLQTAGQVLREVVMEA